jgi:hypothetical protein
MLGSHHQAPNPVSLANAAASILTIAASTALGQPITQAVALATRPVDTGVASRHRLPPGHSQAPRRPDRRRSNQGHEGRHDRSSRLGSGSGLSSTESSRLRPGTVALANAATVVKSGGGERAEKKTSLPFHALAQALASATADAAATPVGLHPVTRGMDHWPIAARATSTREGEPRRHHPSRPDGHAGGWLQRRRGGRGGEERESGDRPGSRPCRPAWGSDAGEDT